MYVCLPEGIKKFFEENLKKAGMHKKRIIPEIVAGFLLSFGKISYESISKAAVHKMKCRTSVRKFFERKNFHSRDMFKETFSRVLRQNFGRTGRTGLYVLLLDGTCIKRGGDTRIENALKYREKKIRSKGIRSTKAHTFLMGLLICPNGLRIPVPRFTYYSKTYCRKHRKKYQTQHELASAMIKWCREQVPSEAEFIAVADGFFDSKMLFDVCRENNAVFITVADSARTYKYNDKKYKLHKRAEGQKKNSRTLKIKKGEETHTREHIRCASAGTGKKKTDVYEHSSEILEVSGLGNILAVYSWKKIKHKRSASFKVILCSDTKMKVKKVIELYALRWQIEIYFRELKSELGLCDYTGQNFRACERFVDMCLLSFLYLEWERIQRLQKVKSKKEKSIIAKSRTGNMIKIIRKESLDDAKDWFRKKQAA